MIKSVLNKSVWAKWGVVLLAAALMATMVSSCGQQENSSDQSSDSSISISDSEPSIDSSVPVEPSDVPSENNSTSTPEPVSYTHLDVYKRQGVINGQFPVEPGPVLSGKPFLPAEMGLHPGAQFAEDVYKRQEKGCAVLDALRDGKISESRHESYCALYEDAMKIKEWEKQER